MCYLMGGSIRAGTNSLIAPGKKPRRKLRVRYEKAGVHHARRRRGRVAARGARAAGGDAGDRLHAPAVARGNGQRTARVSPRPVGDRLFRRPERRDRLPLGREPARAAASAGKRSSSQTSLCIVATGGSTSAVAASAATKTIPIVFNVGDDPVRLGLVPSLSRPGGNLTGVNLF
jgi:ABC transporter substrate binding protein